MTKQKIRWQILLIALFVLIAPKAYNQITFTENGVSYSFNFNDPVSLERLNQLLFFSTRYAEENTERSINLANMALIMSRELQNAKGEAESNRLLSYSFFIFGNYSAATECIYKALEMHESFGDKLGIAKDLTVIGLLYAFNKDILRSLEYHSKADFLFRELGEETLHAGSLLNISNNYLMLNKVDSAEKYINDALSIAKKYKDTFLLAKLYSEIGDIYLKASQTDLAHEHYKMVLTLMKYKPTAAISPNLFLSIAQVFMVKKQRDSAIYYAKQGLEIAYDRSYPHPIMTLSEFISNQYHNLHDNDSAYVYLKLAAVAKDTLYNQASNTTINQLTTAEAIKAQQYQLFQNEKELERKRNIENWGILLIIILTITAIAIWGTNPEVNRKIIKWTGVITLVISFEFISLFLHPHIEEFTHHSQFFTLAILTVIAATFSILHRLFENWFLNVHLPKLEKKKEEKAKKLLGKISENVKQDDLKNQR